MDKKDDKKKYKQISRGELNEGMTRISVTMEFDVDSDYISYLRYCYEEHSSVLALSFKSLLFGGLINSRNELMDDVQRIKGNKVPATLRQRLTHLDEMCSFIPKGLYSFKSSGDNLNYKNGEFEPMVNDEALNFSNKVKEKMGYGEGNIDNDWTNDEFKDAADEVFREMGKERFKDI